MNSGAKADTADRQLNSGPAGAGSVDPRVGEAFARAERHSRRVRRLKIILPVVSILGGIGFLLWPYLTLPSIDGLSADGAAVSDGKLVMANPKLDGYTKDNLPYSMTAARATQDLTDTSKIVLEEIDARVPISADNSANILAAKGTYDRENNTLSIDSAIRISTSDGMTAEFQSADVDMASGAMKTPDPVKITMNRTEIEAESMNVTDNGKVMIFERRVRVNISPDDLDGVNSKAGNADASQ